MLNPLRFRALVMMAVGGLLGYVVATSPWNIHPAALAQQSTTPSGDREFVVDLDRTILPIADPKFPPITEIDARKAKAPPFFQVKPPQGAPNVVIVLIDDMGFGQAPTPIPLSQLVINPSRPDRSEPRAVKRRPKPYSWLNQPRTHYHNSQPPQIL